MMTLPSKFSKLRELAEKLVSDEWREIDLEHFNDEANPQTVLALLDELDKLHEQNDRLVDALAAKVEWEIVNADR